MKTFAEALNSLPAGLTRKEAEKWMVEQTGLEIAQVRFPLLIAYGEMTGDDLVGEAPKIEN